MQVEIVVLLQVLPDADLAPERFVAQLAKEGRAGSGTGGNGLVLTVIVGVAAVDNDPVVVLVGGVTGLVTGEDGLGRSFKVADFAPVNLADPVRLAHVELQNNKTKMGSVAICFVCLLMGKQIFGEKWDPIIANEK